MLRKNYLVILTAFILGICLNFNLMGCSSKGSFGDEARHSLNEEDGYGVGGPGDCWTLPFVSGEYWIVTRGFNEASHTDYNFRFGDDSYALDFAQEGCEPYGKPVTPLSPGTVYSVTYDGSGDHGYGNSVIIDHGDDYYTRYAHLSAIYVDEGDEVDICDEIGAVGDTGNVEGSACPDHPGTHLHLVLYELDQYGWPVSIPPEPMSWTDYHVGCWYSREGDMDCGDSPGDYSPVDCEDDNEEEVDNDTDEDVYDDEDDDSDDEDSDDDDSVYESSGELSVEYMDISPSYGTEDETFFVWTAVIDSPDGEPDAWLMIYNYLDEMAYPFEMDLQTDENPWVFTYRKTLQEAWFYSFWVETEKGNAYVHSTIGEVEVDETCYDEPGFTSFSWSPNSGMSNSTDFTWEVSAWSEQEPEIILHIVNPLDAYVYDFQMDTDEWYNTLYEAEFEKELEDEVTYPFWVTIENSQSAQSTTIGSVDVN